MKHEPTLLEMCLTKLAFRFYGKSVYQVFADRLRLHGGERVLDFGCGMGTVAYYLAGRLKGGHLTCLDRSRRWLEACRKNLRRYENVHFHHSDREIPLLADSCFDVVYCHFVLHDIAPDKLEGVIAALARSLQSGGVFVLREPLHEAEALNRIKDLTAQQGLLLKESRITDVPLMGNTLESVYGKVTVADPDMGINL